MERVIMISYLWTDGTNKDFQSFYQKTEEYYSKIAGGLENRKDFVPYNISDTIDIKFCIEYKLISFFISSSLLFDNISFLFP